MIEPGRAARLLIYTLQTYPAALIGQNNPSKSTIELENESSIHMRPAHCEEKPNQNSPDSKIKPLKLDAAQTINIIMSGSGYISLKVIR